MGKRTWTEEQLINAVKKSISMRQVIRELNLNYTGGNYANIKRNIKKRNLDTNHFLGQGARKGTTHNHTPKKSLEEILIKNSEHSRTNLKARLLRENILINKCSL